MSRLYDQRADLRMLRARSWVIPIVSTLFGSALGLLPVVTTIALLPPIGLLVLLSWRLLRPELWPIWVGLPLGFADDLISGQPIGSAMALWTASLIVLEMVDNRLVWRNYWQEWVIAAALIALCVTGGWALATVAGGGGSPIVVVPQLIVAILCFPLIQRGCAVLDAWRLAR